jgi:hypothetical protein
MTTDVAQLIADVCHAARTIAHPTPAVRGGALAAYELCRLAGALFPDRRRSAAYVLGFQAGLELQGNDIVPPTPFARWTDEAKDYAAGIRDAVGAGVLMELHFPSDAASAAGGA